MQIFWVPLHTLKYDDFFKQITAFKKPQIVFTPNPEILLHTLKDPTFKKLLLQADYLTIDGIWLYLGFQAAEYESNLLRFLLLPYFFARIIFARKSLYQQYGERICGSDLTRDLVEYAEKNKIHIAIIDPYFPDDAKKVASQRTFITDLQAKHPKLIFDYYIYQNPDEIHEKIASSKAQILFSTLGMKTQEQSVITTMNTAKNIKLGLWVGSSFDAIIWFQKRSPKIVSQLWLEWGYRILTTPNKKRQLQKIWRAIVVFSWEVVKK